MAAGRRRVGWAVLLATVVLMVASPPAAAHRSETRIRFAKGTTSGQVTGTLTSMDDVARYVLWARKGQHMVVTVEGDGPIRGVVVFPRKRGSEGGPGGTVFDGILPATGNYRLRITESPMGEAWQGRFTVTVSIV